MASHDLASPLRVLRARAKLLQHQQRYDEASVVAILQQTERMERMISDLRERVLLEGDGLVLQRETVDLVTLAADAVGRAGLLTTAATVRLDVPEGRSSSSGTATGWDRSSTPSSTTRSSTHPMVARSWSRLRTTATKYICA